MCRTIAGVLFATSASLVPAALAGQGKAPSEATDDLVTWQGKDLPRADVVADDAGLQALLAAWGPFAAANGYRLLLADDRRVLLVVSDNHCRLKSGKERHEVEQFLELTATTNTFCDGFLAPEKAGPPLLMFCTRHGDYPKLMDRLGELHPAIKHWTGQAGKKAAGFTLSEPLVAAWIDDPPGVTEWNSFNELVHRLAQLRIRRQTPFLPDWLLLGLSWHVEDAVRRSVYCFPHRSGFVSAASHTDWGLWLANAFKKSTRKKEEKSQALELAEFADWQPQYDAGFDSGKAYLSFGAARYLVTEHLEELRTVCKKLGEATEKGRKVVLPDTCYRNFTRSPFVK